jgi:hypothetical protein
MTKHHNYRTDAEDSREAWKLVGAIAGCISLLIVAVFALFLLPGDISEGLGVRAASIIGFFITAVLLVIFAIVAGDGIFGELPWMLLGFLIFWGILTFWIAWAF